MIYEYPLKACLYSAIGDRKLFDRVGFYRDDIRALSLKGDDVISTNSIREIWQFRPALLVAYFYSYSLFAAIIGRLIGAKVVLTGGADQISSAVETGFKLFLRRASALACLLVANRVLLSCSDDFENFERLCFGLSFLKRKLEICAHVVEPTPLISVGRKHRAACFRAFTICWMGAEGNVRRKGVDRAVELIGKLRQLGIEATLEIAGTDGPGRSYLEDVARRFEVEAYVKFLGTVSEEEKYALFADRDVYLQLSQHEGFGVAAAEAFFSGMVVVHSNQGGLRDVIGKKGMTVNPDNVRSWGADEVKKFYSDFLRFEIDFNYLEENLSKYSVQARAHAFFREL